MKKKKIGRPKVKDLRKVIAVRVSDDEAATLQKHADKRAMKLSTFLRVAAIETCVR